MQIHHHIRVEGRRLFWLVIDKDVIVILLNLSKNSLNITLHSFIHSFIHSDVDEFSASRGISRKHSVLVNLSMSLCYQLTPLFFCFYKLFILTCNYYKTKIRNTYLEKYNILKYLHKLE